MNREKWTDLRRHLTHFLDNEVRVLKERDLVPFDSFVQDPDASRAGRQIAALLKAGPLSGDLLLEVARRFEAVVGAPVTVSTVSRIEAHDIDQWTVVPGASTMERPLSGPLQDHAAHTLSAEQVVTEVPAG
jgi:hypothetical protein